MSASPQKAQPDSKLDFRDWPEVLATAVLPDRIRESYAITLRWYLSWCRRGRVAVDHTSARQFIDWTVEQKQPEAWKLEQWKEALRWFFRAGRACRLPEPPAAANEPVQAGPPELAESRPQEGSGPAVTWSDWIESARRLLRIRHMSYRTEQSYLGWARRFGGGIGIGRRGRCGNGSCGRFWMSWRKRVR